MPFEFETYMPLFLLFILPVMLYFYAETLVNRPKYLRILSFAARLAAIILLILALCRPSVNYESKSVHYVCMIDVSDSVDAADTLGTLAKAEKFAKGLGIGDSYTCLMLGDGIRQTTFDDLKKSLDLWSRGMSSDKFRSASRIGDAMLASRFYFPAGKSKRIVLFSDGMDTSDGELAKVIRQMNSDGVDIRTVPLKGISKTEAAIKSFTCSAQNAYKGEMLRFDTRVIANEDMSAVLRIANRSVVLKEIKVRLRKDREERIDFEFPATDESALMWEAELVPEKDYFPMNNFASCPVRIKGAAKVLALHTKPQMLRPFVKAMKGQDIEVEVRGKSGFPASVREMSEFDTIIIADFPASAMSLSQMEALKSYVRDFGGSLIMTGSENSFGLGGYYKTPVEDVLPLMSRYEKEKEQPSMAMVLVLDKSGSMEGAPIALAREAAKAAVELIGQRDQIGVVAFDGDTFKVCDMTSGTNKFDAINAIDTIAAGGGTNMYPALATAKEMLEFADAKVKHVIVLTDGQSTAGDFLGITTAMSDSGMTLSTVALGSADKELLNRMAELGKGRYYETNDAESIPRIFAKETVEASKSAIKEEPFSPVSAARADFLDGIDFDSAPPLLGYVMTRARPGAKTYLLAESGDPLLASARFGLGNSLAFTSDMTTMWASEWLDWKGYGKFWSQAIRGMSSRAGNGGISVAGITSRGGCSDIRLSIADESGKALNSLDLEAVQMMDDSSAENLAVRQTGSGLYELSFRQPKSGESTIRIADKTGGRMRSIDIAAPRMKEYLPSSEPPAAFRSLPAFDFDSPSNGLLKVSSSYPLRNILCMLALFFGAVSIFLRRI